MSGFLAQRIEPRDNDRSTGPCNSDVGMNQIEGQATYRAHANIAFLKYWGVKDGNLNLPYTNSLSMTLSHAHTTTTVKWLRAHPDVQDQVIINGRVCYGPALERIVAHLDRIRTPVDPMLRAHVHSQNNFPVSAGIASSASGFCALTLAAQSALPGQTVDDWLSLACRARLASGSACRSFFGGFVEWEAGQDHTSSVPYQLHPPDHWALYDIVTILDTRHKAVSSHDGHRLAATSPILSTRLAYVTEHLSGIRQALQDRDLDRLGPIVEADALFMHAVMLTSQPPLLYLNNSSVQLMELVRKWRYQDGIPVYFTVDAGPNLHLLCEAEVYATIVSRLRQLNFVQDVIINHPGPGPVRLTEPVPFHETTAI